MSVLVVLSLSLTAVTCHPGTPRTTVMPRLHLAYLVEEAEYARPQGRRLQRQASSSAVSEEAEDLAEAEYEEYSEEAEQVAPPPDAAAPPRSDDFAAAIARILKAAGNPPPQEIDEASRSYSGRRRRSEQSESADSSAEQYGLLEPRPVEVKIHPHGNFGKVIQTPVVVQMEDGKKFLNGAKERRKRTSDNFIPFSEYEGQRVKNLKDEEIGFLATDRRNQLEQQAGQLEEVRVQLTAAQ